MNKITIEVELPTHIWEARVVIPNQAFCREHQDSAFFYSEEDARKYLIKECRRIEGNILESHGFVPGEASYKVDFSNYEYCFQIRDKYGFRVAQLNGFLYKRSIG